MEANSRTPAGRDAAEAYIKTAGADTVDFRGRLTIAAGTKMIVDPVTGECAPATPENIEFFAANGMSFSIRPDDFLAARLDGIRAAAGRFHHAIAVNAAALEGEQMPHAALPPLRRFLAEAVSLETAFASCAELKAPRDEFLKHLRERGVLPAMEMVQRDVREAVESANSIRIFELSGWGVRYRVYALFAVPAAVAEKSGARELSLEPCNARTLGVLEDFIDICDRRFAPAQARLTVFGSFLEWDGIVAPPEKPRGLLVLASPKREETAAGEWHVRHAPFAGKSFAARRLLLALHPETKSAWRKRIEALLEDGSFHGSMTVSRMAELAGIPQDGVLEVFDDLRREGAWRSARNSATRELAIEARARGTSRDAGSFIPVPRRWLWRWVGALCSAGAVFISLWAAHLERKYACAAAAAVAGLWLLKEHCALRAKR